ncbi:MAG: inositol monophosphatase family protein, partial [Dokdonella sp.]
MSPEFLRHALSVAHAAADAASLGIRRRYHALDFSVDTKSDQTPVTEADREAESTIKRVLRAAFPDHAFYGEEEGREGEGDFLWLIDPIDGTRAFVRGYPMFSTQIALMHRGQLVLGVSDACEYGERAWATRDGGAFFARHPQTQSANDINSNINSDNRALHGLPIQVSSASEFDAACAISTGNLKSLAANPSGWNALAGLIGRVGRIRGYG